MKGKIKEVVNKKNTSLKPFIRWAGGKQNLINEIYSNLSFNNVRRYFEPFLGGASFFLKGDFEQSFLSDLNPNLINCYEQIKRNPESIFIGLNEFELPISESKYYSIRKEFNKHNGEQTLEQAIRFIFLNRTSFNGIYRVNKSGEYNVPFGKKNPAFSSLEHLKLISEKLQSATLFNDYYDSIENITLENDLIYLDPPYPKLSDTAYFNHYTLDKFDLEEQERLADFASRQSNNGCKVVISNADLDVVRHFYQHWEIKECSTYRYISCKKERIKVKELIIKNF
ncbi:Dam family site-specific DNA-(adenine-N6)-methyltransferase [Vitellibacter sp. q18]|jgi:DNA adenine methylase|nr:Dam family site-specific DNA-(adenine-N6)-methyltransferase [Aequorivita lutea]